MDGTARTNNLIHMTDRKTLYRFPWSKTDNPGGWVEVTDICDMQCTGCYRAQLEGHRDPEDVYQDIMDTVRLTNCDCMTIAGGEPLCYPHLPDVIRFIRCLKIKPLVLTNGQLLTREMASELKNAGLAKIHFHIDSSQKREGWEGKSEAELNELRQYYADTLWELKGIQCGFHVTVYRSNQEYIPSLVAWCLQNLQKVQHISFIAYRAIIPDNRYRFVAEGKFVDPVEFSGDKPGLDEISITSEEMAAAAQAAFPGLRASAYLNGSSKHEINKFLNIATIGSKNNWFGVLGPKTIELAQVFYHLFNGRYFAFLNSPAIGPKVFLASVFDREIAQAFKRFLRAGGYNPLRLFDNIYVQSIHFQQPTEVDEGVINWCDDCPNMMAYHGKLINPCRLDEYRKFGGSFQVIRTGSDFSTKPV